MYIMHKAYIFLSDRAPLIAIGAAIFWLLVGAVWLAFAMHGR